jgi:hypothetical protein
VSDGPELEHPLARIGALVEGIERLPDADARERARGLVQAVLDIHRVGLARLLALASELEGGPALIDELARDQAFALILALHDLHPRDVETRVRDAVDGVAPALLEMGVAIDILAVTDENVRVRVKAAGKVRAGQAKIRAMVEEAIGRAAPEVAAVEFDGLDPTPLVPITRLPQRSR